jgi:predicted DNA-binding transcriptional regulator AlpA
MESRLKYSLNGKKYLLNELVEMTWLKKSTIYGRIQKGQSIEQAISPIRTKTKLYTLNWEKLNIKNLSLQAWLSERTIYHRINVYGYSVEEAITKKPKKHI